MKKENRILLLCLLLTIIVASFDYITGYELSFSVFYLLPITISVWYGKKNFGIILSLISSVIWFSIELLTHPYINDLFILTWNALVRFIFFILTTILLSKIKQHMSDMEEIIIKLQDALNKEKELNEMKTRFVSMISHEFRTPLSIITSSSEILEIYSEKLNENEKSEHFLLIKNEIDNLIRMIDDILLLGKVDSNKVTLHYETFNVKDVCNSIVNKLEIMNQKSNQVHCIFSGSNEYIKTDKKLLEHIVINIVNNSIKYSNNTNQVILDIYCQEKGLDIKVIDHGIGIHKDDLKNIFNPFFRGKNISNISGNGIGLYIVNNFITVLKGKINVESTVGKGTCFNVFIPNGE